MTTVMMKQAAAAAEEAASEMAQQPFRVLRQCSRLQVRLREQ
jgi:hypothetical protein